MEDFVQEDLLKLGHIFLFGHIDSNKSEEIMSKIWYVNACHKKIVKKIHLYIESDGGEIMPSICICNAIKRSKLPITTHCFSKAMSGAFLVFLCGEERIASKNALFMSHQFYFIVEGTYDDHITHNVAKEHYKKIMLDIISVTNIKDPQKTFFTNTDYYFNAQEALKMAVATEIKSC